ncbi:MAG: preprotein translocase subunit SecE [Prevotellaceae bacterium]|nr:preprotein translocase subunit SecE [Candidatus Colivivens equi]MCQ2076728.1 preprotein translocase subunit SecE [Bacteroidaceae bacterium]
MFKSIALYCKESFDELVHKTTWPTRKELMETAVTVLIASIIIAIIVFAIDSVFEQIMKLVYSFIG